MPVATGTAIAIAGLAVAAAGTATSVYAADQQAGIAKKQAKLQEKQNELRRRRANRQAIRLAMIKQSEGRARGGYAGVGPGSSVVQGQTASGEMGRTLTETNQNFNLAGQQSALSRQPTGPTSHSPSDSTFTPAPAAPHALE